MSKKVVLTDDEISMLSVIEDNQNIEEVFNILKSTDGGWVLMAIQKRFEAQNLTPDHKVMVAILYLGECAIGKR